MGRAFSIRQLERHYELENPRVKVEVDNAQNDKKSKNNQIQGNPKKSKEM